MSIELYEFVKERQEFYEHDIHLAPISAQKAIAEVLWEQLTCAYSLISPVYRLSFFRIYRIFYFYFTPICYLDNSNNTQ